MNNHKIRVAVNGYGVIGKRVAAAVQLQPDMELVGVGDVVRDYRVKTAVVLGLPIYASLPDKASEMKAAGIPVVGTLDDLLAQVDVVVDCTPKGIGARNLENYRAAGVKAVVQGGEKHSLPGLQRSHRGTGEHRCNPRPCRYGERRAYIHPNHRQGNGNTPGFSGSIMND